MPSMPCTVLVAPVVNSVYEASNAPDARVVVKPSCTSCATS